MDPTTTVSPTLQARRSRTHRTPRGKRIELTPRDLEIFKLLARYRYLRSTYIHAFVGGHKTKLIERLGHLYHEGRYLDRPEQQWEMMNARYMPVVYELGEAGECALGENGIVRSRPRREGKPRRFRHELMVSEVLASIELETRSTTDRRFISWEEILASPKMPEATRNSPNPIAIAAEVSHVCSRTKTRIRIDGALIPDAVFGIEYSRDGQRSYRFFALEADRNTEPVIRGNNGQSSFARKIQQYADVIRRALYRTRWGLPNLLVLTVTTSDRHMHALLHSVQQSASAEAADHFLFRSVARGLAGNDGTSPVSALLTAPWHRAGLEPLSLA